MGLFPPIFRHTAGLEAWTSDKDVQAFFIHEQKKAPIFRKTHDSFRKIFTIVEINPEYKNYFYKYIENTLEQ